MVNRYTGKAIRLCITAVEACTATVKDSVKPLSLRPRDCIREVFQSSAVTVLRVDSGSGGVGYKTEVKILVQGCKLCSEEPITEFICSVNYI
jgi:hypothetical protein